jgi:hypothetical protein
MRFARIARRLRLSYLALVMACAPLLQTMRFGIESRLASGAGRRGSLQPY